MQGSGLGPGLGSLQLTCSSETEDKLRVYGLFSSEWSHRPFLWLQAQVYSTANLGNRPINADQALPSPGITIPAARPGYHSIVAHVLIHPIHPVSEITQSPPKSKGIHQSTRPYLLPPQLRPSHCGR